MFLLTAGTRVTLTGVYRTHPIDSVFTLTHSFDVAPNTLVEVGAAVIYSDSSLLELSRNIGGILPGILGESRCADNGAECPEIYFIASSVNLTTGTSAVPRFPRRLYDRSHLSFMCAEEATASLVQKALQPIVERGAGRFDPELSGDGSCGSSPLSPKRQFAVLDSSYLLATCYLFHSIYQTGAITSYGMDEVPY